MTQADAASSVAGKPIELIVFPGGLNWPVWVAQEHGFFARHQVSVNVTPTPSSIYQLTNLIDGKYDIALTAMDNVIAYMEGQGEAPTACAPDLVVFMGGDNGFLRLVTAPEVKTYADLKGCELSVDARTTGYAFVLQKLLEIGGLTGDDYTLVSAGGVLQRFEALLARKHAGTLLISPFEVIAQARGFNRLADGIGALGHYQGVVGTARRTFAKEREAELVGFIRAYVAGLDWLFTPANRDEAVAILRRNLPHLAAELAEKTYDILLHPTEGFARRAELDLEGIRTVLALRAEYGEPSKEMNDPEKYVDLGAYRKALQR